MRKCKGCGAVLQSENPDQPGYTPKAESEYCQRCYRLIHYGDLTYSMRKGIDADQVLEEIRRTDSLILWVVDLFDFEAGMISGLNRYFENKDIILAATKRDLLPETLSDDKAARFVFTRLKEYGIHVRELILVSKEDEEGLQDIKEAVRQYAHGRNVMVMGRANSGKSTLLNRLMGTDVLTMSRYPGTTLAFNEIEIDGQKYIDTPGIEISHSMLMEVAEKDLKTIVPARPVKPIVFQLKGNQSFQVGGLVRLDLYDCDKASCVWYLSDQLKIHRSKVETADALWKKHYGSLFRPVPLKNAFRTYDLHMNETKMDVAIDGLGWAGLHGHIGRIQVHVPENVDITFRKAML